MCCPCASERRRGSATDGRFALGEEADNPTRWMRMRGTWGDAAGVELLPELASAATALPRRLPLLVAAAAASLALFAWRTSDRTKSQSKLAPP